MKIAVIGTGYVGLVTGTCFAEMGNSVTCIDIDARKIAKLYQGQIPIYEPGLEPLVQANVKAGLLHFTTDLGEGIKDAKVIFIAVGTPQGEDGSADLQYVLAAARSVGENLHNYCCIVDKSTVPVGTAELVEKTIGEALSARGVNIEYDVASNPEFLKEGAAVQDFLKPDRIIVGTQSERARNVMRELYQPFMRNHEKLMFMGVREAELTKYVANAMLATKISFINEMSTIAERVGADIEQVRLGIGADQRIGYHFIYPGCGYGGSCFPKDVKALIKVAEEHDVDPLLLNAVEQRNSKQKEVLFEKLHRFFDGDLKGRTISLWGLAFKPGTDDVREASSLTLIRQLLDAGATIQAHDPVAVDATKIALGSVCVNNPGLCFIEDQYQALEGADALVLVTEWKQYRQPDFELIKKRLKTPLIVDGRNQYQPQALRNAGFVYSGIGRTLV